MKLLTKELLKKLPKTYKADGSTNDCGRDPMLYVKLFTPWTNWTWWIAQYDPETQECFGLCEGFEREWGYFSLAELSEIRGFAGLKIERDLHFTPCKFSELKL